MELLDDEKLEQVVFACLRKDGVRSRALFANDDFISVVSVGLMRKVCS
jgi:hypothetical protein